MALSKKEANVVKNIKKRFGNVIDLKKSPAVLIEILRNFGHILDNGPPPSPPPPPPGVGGTGGVAPSTIAVGGPQQPPPSAPTSGESGNVLLGEMMKAILRVQRDVSTIRQILSQRAR